MFDSRPWNPTGLHEGPVPLAPRSPAARDVLPWARRAPLTGAWLDALSALSPDDLSGAEVIELTVAWERLRRGVDASFMRSLGSVALRPCRPEPGDPSCDGGSDCFHDWSREDVATALGLGPQHAAGLLGEARELTSRLPAMLASVEAGATSMLHARKLAGRTLPIDNEGLVAAVAEHVVPLASTRSAGAFDKLVVATIDRLSDPAEVMEAHRRRRGGRPG